MINLSILSFEYLKLLAFHQVVSVFALLFSCLSIYLKLDQFYIVASLVLKIFALQFCLLVYPLKSLYL